ncbi:hypothetical protein ACFVYF_10265 [Streptomyces sp. NPDC058274]|uniref:hypothetical protein n=1 Tax=Streptomyces sp. NPDC058274 TaxID=3346416 RepID=UPI0036EE052F
MSPASVGRVLRLGACATLSAGLVTMGLAAGPAVAEPESDQLWIDAPYQQTLPLGAGGGAPQTRTLDVGLYHDNSNFAVTDGKLSVDVSGLAGVADVTWPANCAPTGTTAVCSVAQVPVIGPDYSPQVRLGVRAADGARSGSQGTITYGATATGGPDGTLKAPGNSFDTTVEIAAGPDLAIADIAPVTHAGPGSAETIPFALTNKGNESAHGFTVKLSASYGLDWLTRYDQCAYTTSSGDEYAPMSYATCTFDEVLAPGESFALPAPLEVALARHALNERLDISVEPGGGATDLSGDDNYLALQIGADNAADFSVTGAAVTGAAGETVTAPLTFKNNGPAWLGNLGSGDPVAVVRLIVPDGTTVTGVPSGCAPHTLGGGYYPQQTGAPRYDCALPYWVLENAERGYAFKLRVDSVVPGTTGAVSIHPDFGEFRYDPDTTNNTAVLAVN